MSNNIEKLVNQGEKIEDLVDKSHSLIHTSASFKRSSRALKKNLCWANFKLKLIVGGIIAILLYFFIAAFCGLDLHEC
jgi:hypothetical protein